MNRSGTSERYTLTFQIGERQASFELLAGSVLNPFALGILSGFQCPQL
jgi:type VI secretion system protein ImpL